MSRRIPALVLAIASALAVAPAAQASRSQFTILQASRELRSDDAGLRARTFDEIQALGVHWIRVIVYWHDVAPAADSPSRPDFDATDPAAYPATNWARYDRIVNEASQRDTSGAQGSPRLST